MNERPKKRIGEILIEDGIISNENLDEALQHQKNNGGLLGQILIELGYVSEEQLVGALGKQLRIPYLPLACYSVNMEAVHRLEEAFCRKAGLIAFDADEKRVFISLSDPLNSVIVEQVRQITQLKPQIYIGTATEIMNMLDLAFSKTGANRSKTK